MNLTDVIYIVTLRHNLKRGFKFIKKNKKKTVFKWTVPQTFCFYIAIIPDLTISSDKPSLLNSGYKKTWGELMMMILCSIFGVS